MEGIDIIALVGLATPLLTAIAAKVDTPDWWKGLLSITWAALAAVINTYVDHGGDWNNFVLDFFSVWAVHLMSWLGLTREWVRKVHEATAGIGVPTPRLLIKR